MFIATLIASDGLKHDDVECACDLLRFNRTEPKPVWLDDGIACDIFYDAQDFYGDGVHENAGVAGHMWLDDMFPHIDIIIQAAVHRDKRLLIADMDSTMITVECIDELADYAGIKPEIAEITERAMRGELEFEAALDARVALLAGLDEAVIERCLRERVTIMPGAVALVRTMKARGATAILVSGGFSRFAEPVAREIGFDRAIANRLLIDDGKLTGKVAKPIVGSGTKLETLLAATAEFGLRPDETLAVGDGANDLAMIERAGLGVAYHAKPIVAAAARARVDHGDLTALLYAQGIRRADWVTD